MNFKYLFILTVMCLLIGGCKADETANAANKAVPNPSNVNKPIANTEKIESVSNEKVFSSLETPKDTFKSHYAALAANNDELLRKTLAAGMLSLYGELFPDQKIVEMMRETLKKQGETTDMPEIVSEKINGSNAVIKWKANDQSIVEQPLIKEKDGWKMAMSK
jgi:hypothetical protein